MLRNDFEFYHAAVHNLFTFVLEIYSHAIPNARLNLPQAPVGAQRVANEHAGFQNYVRQRKDILWDKRSSEHMDMGLGRLIAARICHDIVSPLGAISNGVELLDMSRDVGIHAPEMGLISESVSQANARIRFFRIAFGPVGPDQSMSAAEVHSVLEDLRATSRLVVGWDSADPVARQSVKLAFLMLMCIETGMPWGGTVRFEMTGAGWKVQALSERLRIEASLWTALMEGKMPDAVSPSQVQFPLAISEAQVMGYDLTVRVEDGTITAAAALRESENRMAHDDRR